MRLWLDTKPLSGQSVGLDADDLDAERKTVRPAKTKNAIERSKTAYGKHFDYDRMRRVEIEVASVQGEDMPTQKRQSILARLRASAEMRKPRQHKPKKLKNEKGHACLCSYNRI